jgi:hypothetical protein
LLGGGGMILCECGDVVDGDTFKDYIETSANPSTSTIGHQKCGHIFNFVDGKMPKRYSSKTELKSIAMRFAEKNKMRYETIERLLIEVDRLKSSSNLTDCEILVTSFKNVVKDRRG